MSVYDKVARQRRFYETGASRSLSVRRKALKRLEVAIRCNEKWIRQALWADLNKSDTEAYMMEIGQVLSEISYALRHMKEWSRVEKVHTSMAQKPGRAYKKPEPYGVVLIMSPWNYPFLLALQPLVGAIAAGNCCVIKPSAYAPHTAEILNKIVSEAFPEKYVTVISGGRAVNEEILKEKFDYIFFTGSERVGQLVMKKAAETLTPVTLELGGKSPCIVDESAALRISARRIAFGKFVNAGQTCVAPDYVLVDRRVKDEFVIALGKQIRKMYGDEPLKNPEYPCIINEKHFQRLLSLMKSHPIAYGGGINVEQRKIAPTIVVLDSLNDPLMKEEIFGPILPVIAYDSLSEAENIVRNRKKPLALYIFTQSPQAEKRLVNRLSFGGCCINDTVMHLANPRLPFGGVGASDMGRYHGRYSFETFSREKSILKTPMVPDVLFRYPPYGMIKKLLIRLFV